MKVDQILPSSLLDTLCIMHERHKYASLFLERCTQKKFFSESPQREHCILNARSGIVHEDRDAISAMFSVSSKVYLNVLRAANHYILVVVYYA